MRNVYEEISKEQYDKYLSMPSNKWKAEIKKGIPVAWECGYGYYGTDLGIKDGKYYLIHTIGSSCD